MRPDRMGRSPEEAGRAAGAFRRGHVVGGYGEYDVPPDLTSLASVFWVHRAPVRGPPPRHRVVPEPDVSIALVMRERADGRCETRGLFLIGPVRAARVYAPVAGEEIVALRLKPEWCHPLIGAHPRDHIDAVDDLGDIAPALTASILDDLRAGPDPMRVLDRLARTVRERAERAGVRPSSNTAHRALELLRDAGPGASIRSVWNAVESSGRSLRRAVRSATGASPKRLLREKRLAAALYRADRSPSPEWSRIALECGFYDQSHLIRDCNELAGDPPARLHRERRRQPRDP